MVTTKERKTVSSKQGCNKWISFLLVFLRKVGFEILSSKSYNDY